MAFYPPVVIDAAQGAYFGSYANNSWGPFQHGNDLYLVQNIEEGGYGGTLAVYKSSDGGETWAVQDQANYPDEGMLHGFNRASVYYASGDLIYVCITSFVPALPGQYDGTDTVFSTFNMSTDLWGTAVGIAQIGGYSGNTVSTNRGLHVVSPTIQLILFETETYGSNDTVIHCAIFNGTTLSSVISLEDGDAPPAGTYYEHSSSFLDPNGIVHVVYVKSVSSVKSYRYIQVDTATLAVTTPATIDIGDWYTIRVWNGVIVNNDIIFSASGYLYENPPFLTGVEYPVIIRISPYSSSTPTITLSVVSSNDADMEGITLILGSSIYNVGVVISVHPTNDSNWPKSWYTTIDPAGGESSDVLYFFFVSRADPDYMGNHFGKNRNAIYYCTSTDGGATWSAAILLHDEYTNPLTPTAPSTLDTLDSFTAANALFPSNFYSGTLTLSDSLLIGVGLVLSDLLELSDALGLPWTNPDLADSMTLLDLVRIALTKGSRPVIPIYDGCDTPENARDSTYCKGFKDYRTNTLEEIDPCEAIVYEVTEETSCI